MMSEEENWYDGRSSGVKSGGQKTRRVWGSSPNAAVHVTPADTKRRPAKKLQGKAFYSVYAKVTESPYILSENWNMYYVYTWELMIHDMQSAHMAVNSKSKSKRDKD